MSAQLGAMGMQKFPREVGVECKVSQAGDKKGGMHRGLRCMPTDVSREEGVVQPWSPWPAVVPPLTTRWWQRPRQEAHP